MVSRDLEGTNWSKSMAARLFIGRRSAGLVSCLRRPNWRGLTARRALSSEPQSSSDKVTHTGQVCKLDTIIFLESLG